LKSQLLLLNNLLQNPSDWRQIVIFFQKCSFFPLSWQSIRDQTCHSKQTKESDLFEAEIQRGKILVEKSNACLAIVWLLHVNAAGAVISPNRGLDRKYILGILW
jgi:hypothetical protein